MSVIDVESVSKSFGKLQVLEDISLGVGRGEVFGFLGPNGAGKTTTVRILLGLLRPSSGTATVFGEQLENRGDLRRRIGVLLEHDALYKRMSAYANLEYYAKLYDVEDPHDKIQRLLEFVELQDRQSEPIARFSTGMRRKLGIARALVHDPEILFMDEPTSGLDPEAQRMIRELIIALSAERQMTVFLNSHNLYEVQRICTTVAILRRGRIRAYDSIENLRGMSETPTLQIRCTEPADVVSAIAILSDSPHVESAEGTGDTLSVNLNGSAAPEVIALLAGNGIRIEEAQRMVRSLEEIYHATGDGAEVDG
jgi:ABC-2 type transport system ATP-binding protein